jgi:hypothetical protein
MRFEMAGALERPASLREVAEFTRDVNDSRGVFGRAASEFFDEFYLSPAARQAMIAGEPVAVGKFEDAYLGAVAGHLERRWNLEIPDLVDQLHRFLDRPIFAGGFESLKAILLSESPLAIRKPHFFVEAVPLRRARMPRDGGAEE